MLTRVALAAVTTSLLLACGDGGEQVSLRVDRFASGAGAPTIEGPELMAPGDALTKAMEAAGFEFALPTRYSGDVRLAQVFVTVRADTALPDFGRRSVGLTLARDPAFDSDGELKDLTSKVFDIDVRNPGADFPEEGSDAITIVDLANEAVGRVAIRTVNGVDSSYRWNLNGTGYAMTYASPTISGTVPRDEVLAMIASMPAQ